MFGECHAHLFMNGYDYKKAVADHEGHVRGDLIRAHFAEYKACGVTYVREGGDRFGVSVLAKKIAPEYGITYRSPVFAIHRERRYGSIVGRSYSDMREFHARVLEAKALGCDFIKVMFSGIMDFERPGTVTGTPLEEEEIREMIRIAHGEGFAVMAHVNGRKPVLAAVLGGADSVEHGAYLDGECLAAMREQGTVWVPTAATVHNLLGSGRFPDAAVRRIYAGLAENLRRARKMGVRLALGSDAGAFCVPHGRGLLDEYRILSEILGAGPELDALLSEGERVIREKF